MGSQCIQGSLTDVVNLLFALVFFLVLLVGSFRKNYISGNRSKNWVFVVASACCFLTSIAYFGTGLLVDIKRNERLVTLNWVGCLVRGLVWLVLAASLNVHRTKWERILVLVWWVTSLF